MDCGKFYLRNFAGVRKNITLRQSLIGISGVYTQCSSWHKAGNSSRAGAQIDMLIDRSDRIINLCEMKFLEGEYVINKEEELKLRTRRQTFYRP